jgi:ribose transport system substrate-binding protein
MLVKWAVITTILSMFIGNYAIAGSKYRVAFFAASSQNGFNQAVYTGIKRQAKAIGNVDTVIYNGEFSAAIQYNQIEDVIASKKFDAFIVLPNDTVGIAQVVQEAIDAGFKVATTLFPIGPDLFTLEPQVKGLTATVAAPPADGAALQAKEVIKFCADKNPCNVIIMIGQKIYPFDNLRYNTYLNVLKNHNNIKIRATVEGNYDPDKSLSGMQDALQANKNVHVVLSNADQHLVGAEIALEDAGYNIEKLYLSGGGASQIAIDAILEGRWDNTLANFPRSMGERALQAVIDALQGKPVNPAVNMDVEGPIAPIVTKEVLKAHPEFEAEWQG